MFELEFVNKFYSKLTLESKTFLVERKVLIIERQMKH